MGCLGACAIKAKGPFPTMRALARMLADIDAAFPTISWFERGCSFSNPSDLPFRGKIKEAALEFGLADGGELDSDRELVDRVLQFTNDPYQVAFQI